MKIALEQGRINVSMEEETTRKEFSSGKQGWYERADVKIGDTVYTAQVQIYEKKATK